MWKVLHKEVDLGERTSFLDHVYLGCTQRQCEISKGIVNNYRTMFESRISEERTEKLPCSENLIISLWSHDMEGNAQKCVERYCELANKTTQQLYKVSTPCIDDHHFKEEELKSVGELSQRTLSNCSEMLILGTYWKTRYSMVRQQTCSCGRKMDQRLWQTFSAFWSHKFIAQQYCYVGNTAKQCRLGLFQDYDFAGDLKDSKSTSGGLLCIFGSQTFVPICWMCKKQTSVSHSSPQ